MPKPTETSSSLRIRPRSKNSPPEKSQYPEKSKPAKKIKGLTPREEAFCLKYHELGNASEAYRQSYNAKNMKIATVNRTAFEVLQRPNVHARIKALRAELTKNIVLDKAMVLQDLLTIKTRALESGEHATAIKALELLGKHLAMFTDKIESSNRTEMIISGGLPNPFCEVIDAIEHDQIAINGKTNGQE